MQYETYHALLALMMEWFGLIFPYHGTHMVPMYPPLHFYFLTLNSAPPTNVYFLIDILVQILVLYVSLYYHDQLLCVY